MLRNRHYLGDEFYPKIIDEETLYRAAVEKERRMKAFNRGKKQKSVPVIRVPTEFYVNITQPVCDQSPAELAESLYGQIGIRGKNNGNS